MDARFHIVLLSFFMIFANSNAHGIFNVMDFGAISDGQTNSTEAFHKAWKSACKAYGKSKVLIPHGTFLVGPMIFKGPCNATDIVIKVNGDVVAPTDLSLFDGRLDWLSFQYVSGLFITGGGKFDGQGASAWPYKNRNCTNKDECYRLPMSLTFGYITNSTIRGITSLDSKFFHIQLYQCHHVKLQKLNITAPAESPNTDGIHLAASSNVEISDSVIGTGDDCISIGPESRHISVSGVFCGPGHGISVGSLGKNPDEGDVVGLEVRNCTLTGTANGLRIKTWQGSPKKLLAANFTFEDIVMNNVSNPIIIDQEYCPHASCQPKFPSLVKIRDIKYRRIRGHSRTKVAVNLLCSKALPCQDIELWNIHLKYNGDQGKGATSSCTNAKGHSVGTVIPPSCFLTSHSSHLIYQA